MLERFGSLVQIPVLKECDPVRELVALECSLVEDSFEGKRFANPVLGSARNRLQIIPQMFWADQPLVNLHDHAFFVDEE